MHFITDDSIREYELSLRENEKSAATVEKYTGILKKLMKFLDGEPVTKQRLLDYRDYLRKDHSAQSVNGAVCAVNSYLKVFGLSEFRLKLLKVQKRVFREEKREMSRAEYQRLLNTAKRQGKKRLYLLMETICSTGIRVSELEYITVEALRARKAEVEMKGKIRIILIPKQLCSKLLRYAEDNNISSGVIPFIGKSEGYDYAVLDTGMVFVDQEEDVDAVCEYVEYLADMGVVRWTGEERDGFVEYLIDVEGNDLACVKITVEENGQKFCEPLLKFQGF